MKLTPDIVLAGMQDHDRRILGNSLDEIISLIENNPFAERIIHLLHNQILATTPVKNKHRKDSAPNCLGTCLYIAGVSELPYPYHAYSYDLNPHMKNSKSEEEMLMPFPNPQDMVPGAFIFSYSVEIDDWHAGIYLGKIGDLEVAFAQHGHGRLFGPEVVYRNYASPDYYPPSTLKLKPT